MARFYGWTDEYIKSLPLPVLLGYADMIPDIRRDEALLMLSVVTNPHLKAEDQKQLWRELKKDKRRGPPKIMDEHTQKLAKKIEEDVKKKHGV